MKAITGRVPASPEVVEGMPNFFREPQQLPYRWARGDVCHGLLQCETPWRGAVLSDDHQGQDRSGIRRGHAYRLTVPPTPL